MTSLGENKMIETGRVTVPTDVDVIDATIEIINRWKADAIRDCDGTDMPEELRKMDIKQYATYYTTRKDNAWAKANPDEIQQMYLMSDFVTAKSTELKIQIMQHFYRDQLKPNTKDNHRWWEVIDRTTDDVITNWDYDEETGEEVKKTSTKTITESTIDPESGCFHKGEKEKCFAYSHQTFCDKNSFVLAVTTVPGNVHDSVSFFDAYEELINGKYGYLIKNVSLDAGYMTPAICRAIVQNDQIPYMPYKRPMTKKGFFKKYEYVYDEEYDCYLCPNDKILMYTTTTRNGYRQYKSDPKDCKDCPLRNKCTKSKNMTKVIERHLWEEFREYADEIRHTMEWKEIYPQRKETIERVFADCKENNGLRFTRLKGLKKNQQNAWLIFACHNLKKMSLWRGKYRRKSSKNSIYPSKYTKKDNFISKIAYIQ